MVRAVAFVCLVLSACSGAVGQEQKLPFAWPPKVGESYPPIELVDQTGQKVSLASLKGRVVLVELIGMTCAGCIAFAGGHERGPFENHVPQKDLGSIHEYAKRFGKVSLDDSRVAYVQILLYGLDMKAPSADDARRWAEHFKMDRSRNHIVLAGEPRFIGDASFAMIPGFHLVDAEGVLRSDSSGHKPAANLYTELLPSMGKLVEAIPAR